MIPLHHPAALVIIMVVQPTTVKASSVFDSSPECKFSAARKVWSRLLFNLLTDCFEMEIYYR